MTTSEIQACYSLHGLLGERFMMSEYLPGRTCKTRDELLISHE
jgi:hypothetical protein